MATDKPVGGGNKHDQKKPRMDLLPPRPLVEIAQVLTIGAERYGEYNWAKGLKFSRLKAAMDRHLAAWWAGEDLDPDDGLPHLAHLGCELLFAMDLRHTMPEMDDRPVGKVAPPFDLKPQTKEVGEDGVRFEDGDFQHFCNVAWKKARALDLPSGQKRIFSWHDLIECIHEVRKATGSPKANLTTLDDFKVAVEMIRRLDDETMPSREELKKALAMKPPARKRGRQRKMFTVGGP